MYAVRDTEIEDFVEVLLKAGADVNAENKFGWTALGIAREKKKLNMAKRLELAGGIDKGREEAKFVELARKGMIAALMKAIQNGANVNVCKLNGTTALMKAVKEGNLTAVNLLLKAKANVNQKDNEGMTALMYAPQSNSVEIIKALIKAGADINARDDGDQTVLFHAFEKP